MTHQVCTMTTSPEPLVSAFLSQYFFMDAVLGDYMTEVEKQTAYYDMAEIFCLGSDPSLDHIYKIIQSDLLAQTNAYDNFCYLSRTMQLMPESFTPEEQYIIAQKSNGFAYYHETFKKGFFTTKSAALFGLEQAAKNGNTYAAALLSFLSYAGIVLPLNEGRALHGARKLSFWNDLFGVLLQLHRADVTCVDQREKETDTFMQQLLSILCASLCNESEQEMLAHIVSYYAYDLPYDDQDTDDEPHENPVIYPNALATTLEKRLGSQALSGNVMNPTLLKVLRSPILSTHAKQNIITGFREGDTLDALPLHIRRVTSIPPVTRLDVDSPLARKDEYRHILANLSTLDARTSDGYRPLMLVCRDPYVLEEYMRVLREVFVSQSLPAATTECVDLSLPASQTLLSGRDNKAMVNLLNKLKDACPVLFLKNCQDLDDGRTEMLFNFLQVDHRKYFPTAYDNVTLDLSGILPILFATSAPSKTLSRVCDVITLKDVTSDEMSGVLDRILAQKCELYSLTSLDADDSAMGKLKTMTPATAAALVDKAIAHSRLSHAEACHESGCRHTHVSVHLTAELLTEAEKLHIHPTVTRLI